MFETILNLAENINFWKSKDKERNFKATREK